MAADLRLRGKRLLVRADSSVEIGTGHVMRCLALAQAWQDFGGDVTFLMRGPDANIRQRLEAERITIEKLEAADDAAACAEIARRVRAAWVVVDGYEFKSEYQAAIRAAGFPVLFVDDYGHGGEYSAELVLNQNISADQDWYGKRSPHTHLLLGTDYAMLRREFRARGALRGMFPKVARNVLITMGGADSENVSALALRGIAQLELSDLEVKVAVGPSNPHVSELRDIVERLGLNVELVSAAAQMPELMEWADVAVAATGGTAWELLFMQVPMFGISVADNQRPTARRLDEMALAMALNFDDKLTADSIATFLRILIPDQHGRSVMARRGRELVDGKGVERIIGAMLEVRP